MGGSSKKVTVGYDYYLSVQAEPCHGPVDRVHEIIYGERSAWKGRVDDTSSIYVDAPNLFGGRKREGGLRGVVSLLFGKPDQERHPTLMAYQGANCPAYRGVLSLVFTNFMWSSMNPYFKGLWVRAERILKGWHNDTQWYPEAAQIKRLTGMLSDYAITVRWAGERFSSPQSISYALEYRIEGSGGAWTTLASASLSSGAFPQFQDVKSNQYSSSVSILDLVQNSNSVELGSAYSSARSGSIPGGERIHTHAIMQDAYEFRVVKTGGSRQTRDVLGLITTNTGMAYGGEVFITSVVDSIPTYRDMNPAHIIYDQLTNPLWRVNLPPAALNDTRWRAAADTLKNEGFGLSFILDAAQPAIDNIQKVLDHIGGYLKPDFSNGTISLELMRDDYDTNDLVELNDDNSMLVEYQRALQSGDLMNSLTVSFRDQNENVKNLTEHNHAAIQRQGGVIPGEVEYEGIHSRSLAQRVAQRDLRIASSPLGKMTRTVNRVLWNHVRGDVVRVTDTRIGIVNAPYRIVSIDRGDMLSAEMRVELVEDVFGLGDATYLLNDDVAQQYDPYRMLPASHVRIIEVPYWVLYFQMTQADRNTLAQDAGFAMALVTRNTSGAYSTEYDLYSSLDDSTYIDVADGGYSPTGFLQSAVSKSDTTFVMSVTVDLFTDAILDNNALFALVDDEFVSVETYDDATATMTVRRGVLDTVPAAHASGARVMVLMSTAGYDSTQRIVGDLVYYKPLPRGTGSLLPLEDANQDDIVFDSRMIRPYPPGNMQINGEYWPADIGTAPDIEVTWAHRDRLLQTVYLVDFTESDTGPEIGTTYTLQFYYGENLLREFVGISANTFTYEEDDIIADGDYEQLSMRLFSVRDGYASWQYQEHTFTRQPQYPYVESIVGSDGIEGGSAIFTVTFNKTYFDQLDHDFTLTLWNGAGPSDVGPISYSNGVEDLGDGTLAIPAGVLSFTMTIDVIADGVTDPNENISLTMGGITETITIIDEV